MDKALLLLPAFYCYGLSVINTHLASGACVFLDGPSADNREFSHFLSQHQITSFAGVPHTFETLERNFFRNSQLPDLNYITQAGGRLHPELVQKFATWSFENNSLFFVMYGQTEATARIAYLPPDLLLEHSDCIGIAIPGGSLSIHDDNGQVINSPDIEGELVYKGPNIMMGYATESKDLSESPDLAFLATGDLAIRTPNNLFKITGRKKRICKIYGKRFSLDAIEVALHDVSPVIACLSDDKTLFVATESSNHQEIIRCIRNKFGIPALLIKTRRYEKLPTMSSGKTDYRSLQTDFANLSTRKPAQAANQAEAIYHIFQQAFPDKEILKENSFLDLGGDSLNYVAVSIELEEVLGVLPDHWEKLSIHHLTSTLSTVQTESSVFHDIETPIVLRSLAIILIVMFHAHIIPPGGAMILMFLAGLNMSRFQFENLKSGNPGTVFHSLLLNIMIPYWLILIAFELKEGLPVAGWERMLFIGNFFPAQGWAPFYLWFIQILVQIVFLVSLPMLFKPIREWANAKPLAYLLFLLCLALTYRIIDGYFLTDLFPIEHEDWRTSWSLWIFIAGMIAGYMSRNSQKALLFTCITVLAFITWPEHTSRQLSLCLAAALVLWLPCIALPRQLSRTIMIIASASLFIYMFHRLGFYWYLSGIGPWAQVMAGVVQGVIVWKLYSLASNWLWEGLKRVKEKRAHSQRPPDYD